MRLGIVLVNYKGAKDTIECLESLLRSTIRPQIVVVDNNSGDGSVELIRDWAEGRQSHQVSNPDLSRLSIPAVVKPVEMTILSGCESKSVPPKPGLLTIIASPENGGFAAGNNLGIQHLVMDETIGSFWLLNNDTVVENDSAERLLQKMTDERDLGICGTMVCSYYDPDTIQAYGGHSFSWLTGTSSGIGSGASRHEPIDASSVERDIDFITGTSIAVSRSFVSVIGLMNEHYFLYFEEIDWAVRNQGRFKVGFAPLSVVYHKEGASIGSSSKRGARSTVSEYYLMRSRLKFIRAYKPILLPFHYAISAAQIVRRVARRQPDKARSMVRAALGLKIHR